MRDFKVCVEAIHFMLKSFGEMDKLKIMTLFYFADKWHLIIFNRTITGGGYLAMKHGPVGSMVLNVLNKNAECLEQKQLSYIDKHIQQAKAGGDIYKCAATDVSYRYLSRSDMEAIQKVGEKFKQTNILDIVNLTRKYPEWVQFKSELEHDLTAYKEIPFEDMFSCIDNDPLGIPLDTVEVSKKYHLGYDDDPLEGIGVEVSQKGNTKSIAKKIS